jgi:hypothetical protein
MTVTDRTLKHYRFLVRLRNSGKTNMWGASEYLARKFSIAEREASAILVSWIQTFDLPEDEQPKDGRENR